MPVVDASYAVRACSIVGGFSRLQMTSWVAPTLMWSEARSALHEAAWRGEVDNADAIDALSRLDGAPGAPPLGSPAQPGGLAAGHELGWAKTYDARVPGTRPILGCRVVAVDFYLWRGAARLSTVVLPTEL